MNKLVNIASVLIGVIIGLFGLLLCTISVSVGISIILFALIFIPAIRRKAQCIPVVGKKKGLLYLMWIVLACIIFLAGIITFEGDTVDTTTITETQPSTSEESQVQEEPEDTPVAEQTIETNEKYEMDSYWYSEMKHICSYAEKEDIDYPKFREREKVANLLTKSNYDKQWASMTYVEDYSKLSGANEYTMTLEESGDLMYWGEVNKDGKPDGIGILYECYYYVDYDYQNPDLVIRYMGEFKNGFYSGYGVEFEVPDWDADYHHLDLTEESLYIINQPIYEGYFEDGLRHGEGVEILSTLGTPDYDNNTILMDPAVADYSMYIGEYDKNDLKGDVLIYYCGALVYEGEFKEGNINGNGKQYFAEPEGVLKYEGEFSGGEYHGKGTLYDENGDIVYKGEFTAGDIAQ